MKRFPMRVSVLVFACLAGLAICRADELAAVTGLVTDPNGRSVPGVKIGITNLGTNIEATTTTNDQGIYRVPALQPGIYRITLLKDGFKSIVKSGIELHVQDIASINFELQLGSVNETVTVSAGGLVINTTDGAVSTVINRQFAENLPLNGRSFNTLLQLTPGAVVAPSNNLSLGQFSVNGQRTDANYFTVDGVSANFGLALQGLQSMAQGGSGSLPAFNAYGGTSSLVSVDALQEFRVQTSSFAPEYGRSPGGQVAIETRSGTNQFHGDLFDYFRNDKLDANNWFNNAAGLARAPERQNDFGGVFGGPLLHEKTFFFFSYEGLRLRQPQSTVVTVPSLSVRTSPNTVPAAVPYLDAYPKPNGTDFGDGTALFTGSYSNAVTQDAGSVRVDHTFNQKWSLFGRFNDAPSQLRSRANSLSEVDTSELNTKTFTLGVTGSLAASLTNSFRGNYSLQDAKVNASLDSFGGATPPDPGVLLPSPLTVGHASAAFADSLGGYSLGLLQNNSESQVNFLDDVAIGIGSHQLKFGVDYRRLDLSLKGYSAVAAYLIFSDTQTFASDPTAFLVSNSTVHPGKVLFHAVSLYAQDAWRIGSRLVLTYGLRWEFVPPPSGEDGVVLGAWNNTNNPQTTVLAPPGTALWRNTYDNFAPRVGIAYRVTAKGDLVLRGGWGMFYDQGTGLVSNLGQDFPNQASLTLFSVSLPPSTLPTPTVSLQPPYPPSVEAFSSTLTLPRSYQWNVAVEKSFLGQQSLSLTYLGQLGRNLLRNVVEVRPNSNFPGQFHLTTNGDSSNYNALQLQYRRPVSRNVQALLNYTWSHCIDTNSNGAFPVIPGSALPVQDGRGACDFDVRHNFTTAVTYNLPRFAKQRFLGQIVNNWSLDGVAQVRSGFPINVTYSNTSIPGVFSRAFVRPDLVPGAPVWLAKSTAAGGKVLNPAAFDLTTPKSQLRQGTLGRNAIPGFGATQVDLSVLRKFPLTESFNLQFRADLFNVFNHPNFSNPASNLSVPSTFGVATQMLNSGLGGLSPLYQLGGPRSVQLSLKLLF